MIFDWREGSEFRYGYDHALKIFLDNEIESLTPQQKLGYHVAKSEMYNQDRSRAWVDFSLTTIKPTPEQLLEMFQGFWDRHDCDVLKKAMPFGKKECYFCKGR